ncbi:uncharacterized protein LOC109924273 [Rhincodon typus]|uniref:uncharacterized protein LOC109924273 n=1 Tax=Rhincodon typus TaxID=259920 RepID=UPI00202FD3E9|nr:uncharacterized protein LOC109924273 [Rhincodon typus]
MERAAPPAINPSHTHRLEGNMMKSPPSCLKSGNVKVYLKKWSIWDKFYNLGTEMRMSKRGRFMFPYCEYSVSGLDPEKNYIMAMDISPVDNYRYRYNGCKWQINGKATPHVTGRLYFHPNGSVSGKEWMAKPVSFAKMRLTNCPTAEEGNAILHSMHRYVPQLHIIVADGIIEKLNLNDPRVYTFVFQQTEFFAVTKYENKFIRQLKHFYNPYGTALRDVKTSKQALLVTQWSLETSSRNYGMICVGMGRMKFFIQHYRNVAGIKLSDLQLTECINVEHLGLTSMQNVELVSSFPVNESHGIRETGIPFISRTGKTNDLTKIKGWKHKFNLQPGSPENKSSPSPSSVSPAVIKNRSAFVSDLLDEYLEKEGKIIEQSLLYDYEMPEIGCQTPTTLDPSCNIQQNTTRSPDFGAPLKNRSTHLEMSPVLEKHFSVTNKGIFIRDIQSTSVDVKAKCRTQKNDNSAAKRPKIPSQYDNTTQLASNNKDSAICATAPQKKQLKPGSTYLKVVPVASSSSGGKKSNISENQTEMIYISDNKNAEKLEPGNLRIESTSQATLDPSLVMEHPSTTNRSTASKVVEVISYCNWNESRVKVIKLIAECAMANKLPLIQRLDKYKINLEKSDGTLFPPKRRIDVRATIQNVSDSEHGFIRPLVQNMVIEAVVGNSAFKTKLNHLISKVSKDSSKQTRVERLNSSVHVVMDLEKNVSSPEKCPSETSCTTNPSNRPTAEGKAQSFPVITTQKREQGVSIAATDTTVKNVSKAPPPIRSAVTTFQRIGALSTVLTNTTATPTPNCFMNSVASGNKPETSAAIPTRYLLCKTNSSGLSSGSAASLDQDGRRQCIAVPNTLKLQPGDNLMLQPIKAADGRQLYRHSSGKIFQLVYTKTPEQTPVQQLNIPQSPIPGTTSVVKILTSTTTTLGGDANTPLCNTAATDSELCTKTSLSGVSIGSLHNSTPLCDVTTTKQQLQSSPATWTLVDQLSPSQSLRMFSETTTQAEQHDNIIPLADCQTKANLVNLSNDMFDFEMNPVKSSEPGEIDQTAVTVNTFPIKSETLTVTGACETKWVPEDSRFTEGCKRTGSMEKFKSQLNANKPGETHIKVERDLPEINGDEPMDPDGPEICTVTVKEEPLNDEEDNSFAAWREESFRSSKFWNRSFNLNTEAVTEAELGVQTHSSNRNRDGVGNLVSNSRFARNSSIVNNPAVPHRGLFQNSQSFSHSTKKKVYEPSVLCEARKKAILHNLRERESRRMMENRFKVLKNKLFDDRQIASKGAILDEAIDVINNLDRQSKNLTMEKELLLGKQKILLEKISLLSAEMEPGITQDGIEAGEIIETGETLSFSSERVSSSQNSFGMKWFLEDGPLDEHGTDCGINLKYEVNSTGSDDIVAVKVGDYFNEKCNSELDYSGSTNTFAVKREENLSQEDCSTVSSANEECSGSSRLCSFSDFGTDMEALNKMSMRCSEPFRGWIANRKATSHTLRERESRKLMENRFKLLESTVFNDKKAPKGAILTKAIDVISDLDLQSEELFREKELLKKKQKKLLEEISLLADTRSDATEDQAEDEHFFGAKNTSGARGLTFQKPEPHWLESSNPSDTAVMKDNMVSVLSERHDADCTGGADWGQDKLKANSLFPVKIAGDLKEKHYQEPLNPDGYDSTALRRRIFNGKDEDAVFTAGRESSIGSSDFGSHSDFDVNTDDVNEIDVEILSHSDSEYLDIEIEDGEVADGTSTAEKLCAPPRWHFHNYSQSHKFSPKRKIYNSSELRKSRKNPLLHTIREREWRKLMQKRFSELRELLFEDERVSKRAILDEAISEIQNLCQQGHKLYLEKKLLMKKHKALLKIISVLSGEKKVKTQKSDAAVCGKHSENYDHNRTPVSPGPSLSSAVKGNNEESTLVPVAGTPFRLLLEKIAVSPHGEEYREWDSLSQTEAPGTKELPPRSLVIHQQEDAHLAFLEGYSQMISSTQPKEEMQMQKLPERLENISDTASTAIDVASRNLKIVQDEKQCANAVGLSFKSAKDLLSNGDIKKPSQDALYWSNSVGKDCSAESFEKDQVDSKSTVKGKLQVIRSTKGQDILQKLAKKVQEAGIKPWTWKSKREDSENVSQNLFDSESKSMQCFQKASPSVNESSVTQYVYTETPDLLVEDKSLHDLLPGQTLKHAASLNKGDADQLEAELDMDSVSSDGSTTATCAVREPKIFISSVDIHSANEANANGGYLLLDSTQ